MPVDALTPQLSSTIEPAQLVLGGSWVWRHSPTPDTFDHVLDAARNEGITWIDTSPAYGGCVPLTLRWKQRHGAWFSPVVKLPVNEPQTWAPETFEAAARQACRNLNVAAAPVLLLHGPPQALVADRSTWWPEAMDALCALRDIGLAERVGVAADLPVVAATLDRRLDVVQVPLNLADPSALETFMPLAETLGVEVMAARALANCVWQHTTPPTLGYTSGYSQRWQRRGNPPATPPPLEAAVRFVAHAGPRWAIFSTSRPEHVHEIAALARRGPLLETELHLWREWASTA